ncbi:MAG: YbaK/EbsC family protein [Candidatus Nanohaloarchaea archaeon]
MKANRFLQEKNIEFELVKHDPATDVGNAAEQRGVDTSQIVKSLIVERHREKGLKDGEIVHVLLPGDREISEKKFGEHHLVSPEKSWKLSGFESGTVHPFSTNLKHLMDFRLLKKEKLSFTTGEKDSGIVMKKKNFVEGLEASETKFERMDLSQTLEKDIEELKEQGLGEQDARFVADKGLSPLYIRLGYSDEMVLKAFREFLRHETEIEKEALEKVLKASDDLNHLQKNVEKYAENGEIPEPREFEVEKVVEKIFDQNPQALEDLKAGESVENFVIGKAMEITSGKADPERVEKVIDDEYR